MALPGSEEQFVISRAAPGESEVNFGGGQQSSYSLLLLFYLTTAAAILVAACRMAFSAKVWTWSFFGMVYAISFSGLVLQACIIGYVLSRKAWGVVLGGLAGVVTTLVAALMIMIQPVHFPNAGLILAAGSWLLALTAIVANRYQQRPVL